MRLVHVWEMTVSVFVRYVPYICVGSRLRRTSWDPTEALTIQGTLQQHLLIRDPAAAFANLETL